MTTQEIAARFDELAQAEKWFEIQEELFADNAQSIEPANSPYFKNAEGKTALRTKGEAWVSKVKEVHKLSTSQPIVAGNHFAVARKMDLTVEGHGRVLINEVMVYNVKDGKIVEERFFY